MADGYSLTETAGQRLGLNRGGGACTGAAHVQGLSTKYLGTLYLRKREACISLGRCSLSPTLAGQEQLQVYEVGPHQQRCLDVSVVLSKVASEPFFLVPLSIMYLRIHSDSGRQQWQLHI